MSWIRIARLARLPVFFFVLIGSWVGGHPAFAAPESTKSKSADKVRSAIKEFDKYYSNKNEHVRKAAVMGLAECDHEMTVEPLLKAVFDPAHVVREQVKVALGKLTAPNAIAMLTDRLKVRRKRSVAVNLIVLEAFKTSRPDSAYETVLELCEDSAFEIRVLSAELLGLLRPSDSTGNSALLELSKDGEALVRMAAMQSLGLRMADSVPSRAAELLSSEKSWRVRAACIGALRVVRVKASIQPLIDALKGESGRLRDDCQAALEDVTGDAVAAKSAPQWQGWWDRVKDRFKVPTLKEIEKRKKKARAALKGYAARERKGYGFAGVETRSKRMLFLIDVSGSMSERLVLQTNDKEKLAAFRKRYGEASTKIELAREELIRTVESLESYVFFNMVTFHTDLKLWKKSLVAANRGNKNSAIKYLSRLTPKGIDDIAKSTSDSGRTNTFDAINYAFGLKKQATIKPSKNHRSESDTVFLLTDGMPTAGRIQEPGELVRYFTVVNRRAKIVFHTVTFGHGNQSLMRPIAESSGGDYVVIQLD